MGYIYKITNNLNGLSYIGQTSRSYKDRWAEHKRDRFKEPYCNWPLYRMMNSIGLENITWEVIEEIPNNLLNEREQYWINFYNTKNNGYNCTYGGNNGTKHNYNEILIERDKALSLINSKSLLVIVDTQKENYVDCPELLSKTDKIAIIDKGKVVFIGTLKELKDKYDKKDLEELFMEVIKHE